MVCRNDVEDVSLANELISSGVLRSRVKEIFKDRIDDKEFEDEVENRKYENTMLDVIKDDLERLVQEAKPPKDLIDPLFLHLMKDAVVISSGYIVDRSTILKKNGILRFSRCPFTGETLSTDVYPVGDVMKQINYFRMRRDSSIKKIARRLISNGVFESLHDVLDAVESYLHGLGDNYLPLARELAAIWGGFRHEPSFMMFVDQLNVEGTNEWATAVETDGLEEKVFKIVVSVATFNIKGNHANLALALYNDFGELVERFKLFDTAQYDNTNICITLGKKDTIVANAKIDYVYKIEYMAESPEDIQIENLICKIIPVVTSSSSYRMRDGDGEEGIYIGPTNSEKLAHGEGSIDYNIGSRFVGLFHKGSMIEGVLYDDSYVGKTMKKGGWMLSVDEKLIDKYSSNMILFEQTENATNLDFQKEMGLISEETYGKDEYNKLQRDLGTSEMRDDSISYPSDLRNHLALMDLRSSMSKHADTLDASEVLSIRDSSPNPNEDSEIDSLSKPGLTNVGDESLDACESHISKEEQSREVVQNVSNDKGLTMDEQSYQPQDERSTSNNEHTSSDDLPISVKTSTSEETKSLENPDDDKEIASQSNPINQSEGDDNILPEERSGTLNDKELDNVDDSNSVNTGEKSRSLSVEHLDEEPVSLREMPFVMSIPKMQKKITRSGVWIGILQSGFLEDYVDRLLISVEEFYDLKKKCNLGIALYDKAGKFVTRVNIFGNRTKLQGHFRLITCEEKIVAEAKPGYFYQLQYAVNNGCEDNLQVTGWVCKIFSLSNALPPYLMADNDGDMGYYSGPLDDRKKAFGEGFLEYENGGTFVGEFKDGILLNGAYYKVDEVQATMKDKKWTSQIIPEFVQRNPPSVQTFTKEVSKEDLVVYDEDEADADFMICC